MIRCVIVLLASLLVVSGCGKSGSGGVARTTTVTQQQALDLARAAVQEHDSFAMTATYDASPQGNGWVVNVESDNHLRRIYLDAEGKVAKYQSNDD